MSEATWAHLRAWLTPLKEAEEALVETWVRLFSPTCGIIPRELALLAFLKSKCLIISCKYWNRTNCSHNQGKETPCCFSKSRENGPLNNAGKTGCAAPVPREVCAKSLSLLGWLLPDPHPFSDIAKLGGFVCFGGCLLYFVFSIQYSTQAQTSEFSRSKCYSCRATQP